MTSRAPFWPAVVAAAAALAGCGGDEEPDAYRLAPTRDCLRSENVVVTTHDLDFVARTALGGGLRANLARNEVVLAFGSSRADARALERAYRRFGGKRVPLEDVLMRERNVVLVWAGKPSPEDLDRVTGCLEG
jgi:hypothetical protein